MRRSACIINIIAPLIILLLIRCEGIFVPDPIDPRLPKYTEEGNNVAGAFINGEIWKSVLTYNTNEPEIVLYDRKDSLSIMFEGQSSVYSTLEFRLSHLDIHSFDDLILLKNRKIKLDGLLNNAVCLQNRWDTHDFNSEDPNNFGTRGIGQLYIRNVIMNNSLSVAILSGTFGFSIHDSVNGNKDVSYGRFDFRFSKNSNFRIEDNNKVDQNK
ncbi:MAG TPA: hypothetical protein VHO90_16865 [Bacteroidales bacterium]|nr:hypothetical protein [Bacteroidales bacterium]